MRSEAWRELLRDSGPRIAVPDYLPGWAQPGRESGVRSANNYLSLNGLYKKGNYLPNKYKITSLVGPNRGGNFMRSLRQNYLSAMW